VLLEMCDVLESLRLRPGALHAASRASAVSIKVELLERSANVSDLDDAGSTPLLSVLLAAGAHQATAVNVLLDARADVCASRKCDSVTLLMAAASVGDVQIVQELLHLGADVHVGRKALSTDGQGLWQELGFREHDPRSRCCCCVGGAGWHRWIGNALVSSRWICSARSGI